MNGDFARVSFNPTAHYRRVLLQQGRMLLEADFNEQSAIQNHYMRCLVADLKGRWWRVRQGFVLGPIQDNDFSIGYGHAYVDGMLCENDRPPGSPGATSSFFNQPFGGAGAGAPGTLPAEPFLIYIECWEHQIGALEVPGLREIALGGPDTALRTQTVWQIRLQTSDGLKNAMRQVTAALQMREKNEPADGGKDDKPDKAEKTKSTKTESDMTKLDTALDNLTLAKPGTEKAAKDAASKAQPPLEPTVANDLLDVLEEAVPLMRAMAKSEAVNDDPCTIAADSQYRGRENQLYRIEVHDGGTAQTATLKWSRENGSVQFAIRNIDLDKNVAQISLASTGRDARTGLSQGDWVELCGAAVELSGSPGPLGQVSGFGHTPDTVSVTLPKAADLKPDLYTILRRWDQSSGVTANGVLSVVESAEKWIPLERGVQVQFVSGGVYRTGDYWLVPARVASGDVDWPMTGDTPPKPMALPSSGIRRYRAALGMAGKAGTTWKLDTFSYPD